jgi:signal transduction histidine kinase
MSSPTRDLAERLERLVRGGHELTAQSTLKGVLQRVADLCLEVVDAKYAAIGLLAPDRRSLDTFITAGMTPEEVSAIGQIPKGRGVLGVLIHEARPLRLRNLTDHPDTAGFPDRHPAMRSFLGVPVTGRHGVLGNLYLTEKAGGGEFTEDDEHLCLLLAGLAASAVENAQHHEESARLLADVQSLLRSRERFFATVNHELRNSLAAVYGWAEMLVRKKDPSSVPRAAFEVVEAAESAVALINDLLDLSRLDEDRLRPVLQEVDCHVVLRRAEGKVTPAASAKGVTLSVDHQQEIPACRTDAHRVEQILVNLLTNAIRHTPPGSTVSIEVRKDDGRLRVAVSDMGPGIPEDHREHVFDVYYTKAGEEGHGVGLGLPLSRRLARLLGGDLTVSNGPSGGAIFTLILPLPD